MSGVEGSGRAEARFSTLLLNLALKRRSSTAVISKIKIVGQACPTHTHSLPARGQPRSQTLRQVGGENFFLCNAQVVWDAIEADGPGIGIERGKAGAPVPIAGLANRAGINQKPALPTKCPIGRLRLSDCAV